DVARVQRGGGDLVEQRLEGAVGVPVDQCDPRAGRAQRLEHAHPGEAAAHHDDVWCAPGTHLSTVGRKEAWRRSGGRMRARAAAARITYGTYLTYVRGGRDHECMASNRGPRHFASYTQARDRLRDVLDAARAGVVTSVARGSETFVVVRADEQRKMLARLRPAEARVVAEGGGWAVIFPGLPVHGDGESFDAAVDDALQALREYAEAWNDHLHAAPNHTENRAVAELVELSSDDELRAWVLGGEESPVEVGA